ncbi:PREDICTED: uncharacterized protein LOC108567779 [Nicrophorus vespilloides]|uniref:Uncharacterized protein LOC108567779 n=1 Tax=Nicrophorus vespilloides TaxID=110193 RepID=A0ABM1NAT3_NICVS|nr:PREDICTED: uncharacterized protein LOC108567779 [Nicrophorus vespilloides]
MSYTQSSSTSQVNLVEQVLEQGQRLRNAMVNSILNVDPFYQDHDLMPPVKMHCINMDQEKRELSTTEKHKFVAYLRGESMSRDDEKQALETFRAMSTSDICEITERSYHSLRNYCNCDSCTEYNKLNVDVIPPLKINIKPKPSAKLKVNEGILKYLKYVDTLKISVHSLKLNHEGDVKVFSSLIDSRYSQHLSTTYFIEYNIPSCMVKSEIKKSKVDSGLDSSNYVKLCSKKLHKEAIYFKQISIHDVTNIDSMNLEAVDLVFQVSSRTLKQKGQNILGQARFNMGSFLSTKYFNCNQELVVWLINDAPIMLGTIKINLQLGCGRLYFGKEFLDSISIDKQNSILPETIACDKRTEIKANECKKSKVQNVVVDDDNIKKNVVKAPVKKKQVDAKVVKIVEDSIKPASNIVLFGFLYVAQVEYLDIKQLTYFTCKSFCQDDVIYSNIVRGGSKPFFNFYQTIPFIYEEEFITKLRDNFMVLEFFERTQNKDALIGVCKIPLHQYYLAFRNPTIVKYLERNKLPVIGTDWFEPISDPNIGTISGQVQILVALGSEAQIHNLENERGFKDNIVLKAKKNLDAFQPTKRNLKEIPVKQICDKTKEFCNIQSENSYLKSIDDIQNIHSTRSEEFSSYRDHYWRTKERRRDYENIDIAESEKRLQELRVAFKNLEEAQSNEERNLTLFKETHNCCEFIPNREYTQNKSDSTLDLKNKTLEPRNSTELKDNILTKENTVQETKSILIDHSEEPTVQKVDKSTYTVELIDKASQSDMSLQSDILLDLLQHFQTKKPEDVRDSGTNTEESMMQSTSENLKSTTDLLDSLQKVLLVQKPQKSTFKVLILIDSALHLPTKKKCKPKKPKSRHSRDDSSPTTYVTFESAEGTRITNVFQKSVNPRWNYRDEVELPLEFLTNNQKRLIFKVWRKSNNNLKQPDMEVDSVLGFAALDLTVISAGLLTVEGWFNIVDFSGHVNGQMKIHVSPLEAINKPETIPPESSSSTSGKMSPSTSVEETLEDPAEVFSRALKRKFIELDEITQRLRVRLSHATNDGSDTSNDDIADEFERDINTLCVEDDYDMIDFEREAQDLNMRRVSSSLQKLKGDEQADHALMLFEGSSEDPSPNTSLQMDMSAASKASSIGSVETHAQEGKQKINSLLKKLSIQEMIGRHVSGCSAQGKKTDSSNSEEEILNELGINDPFDATKMLKDKVLEVLKDQEYSRRHEPDGEGDESETG